MLRDIRENVNVMSFFQEHKTLFNQTYLNSPFPFIQYPLENIPIGVESYNRP